MNIITSVLFVCHCPLSVCILVSFSCHSRVYMLFLWMSYFLSLHHHKNSNCDLFHSIFCVWDMLKGEMW